MNLYFGFSKVKKERLTNKIYNKPSITVSPCWHVKVCLSIGKVRGGERSCQSTGIGVGVTEVKDCWELTVFEIKDGGGSCKRHGKGEKSYKIDCSSRNKFHAGSEN